MNRIALIIIPLAIAFSALGISALVLPSCAIGVFSWANACPPVAESTGGEMDALTARRQALEAEISALQRRISALAPCPRRAALPAPIRESAVAPEQAAVATAALPQPVESASPNLALLRGCADLDRDHPEAREANAGKGRRTWPACGDNAGQENISLGPS